MPLTRRTFLRQSAFASATGAAALAGWKPSAAQLRPRGESLRVAAVVTEYRPWSHADVICGKFIQGFKLDITPHRRGPGFWQVSSVRQSLHTGAHIDSPLQVFKDGITTAEIRTTIPGWTVWTGACPGGETIADVARRADAVLARVDGIDGVVAVFSHGHFSRVLVARWLGLPADHGRLFAMRTGTVNVLGYEREQRVLSALNG